MHLTDDHVVAAFMERYWKDRDAGRPLDLLGYLEAFPDHQELVASEYAALREREKARSFVAVALEEGGQLGSYRLIEEIGRGGQGIVFRAEDSKLGREVALKVLSAVGPGSEERVQRFRREAEVASKLNHPGICSVHDAGIVDGVPFIAMQLLDGHTLASRIEAAEQTRVGPAESWVTLGESGTVEEPSPSPRRETKPPPEEGTASGSQSSSTASSRQEINDLLRLFEEAARALHEAHDVGVVHRDVKPANIMVAGDGHPVLLDFGLARWDELDFPSLTGSDQRFGTPAYMSPEQLTESGSTLDRRTDVYSLGVSLFECLTLRRPFVAPTRESLFTQIMVREVPDPRAFNSRIPPELKVVLEIALEKDRDRRYQTASDFADDLKRVREYRPIAARPIPSWLKVTRWAQRNPVVASTSLATFLFLALGLVWTVDKNRQLDSKNTALDRKNLELDAKNDELRREKSVTQTALDDVQRLADGRILEDLVERADRDLWPALPAKLEDIRSWLRNAEALLGREAIHRERLERIRERALPYRDEERERDWKSANEEILLITAETARLEGNLHKTGGQLRAANEERIRRAKARLAQLRPLVKTRGSWRFENPEDDWQHALLWRLVRGLTKFQDERRGSFTSVQERLALATTLERRSLEEPALKWTEVIAAISRSELYRESLPDSIKPQVGLYPLGPDPGSGLQEFLHLASHEGPPAVRDARGRIVRSEGTGIILVLIPGGSFNIGAQPKNPKRWNYDRLARIDERLIHTIKLAPYFMSKFEMTQAQWKRVQRGAEPSFYRPGAGRWDENLVTLLHPVEQVSWADCETALRQIDLVLPTEAQWEYAARAGTLPPWSTGPEPGSLQGYANIADQSAAKRQGEGLDYERSIRDGFNIHAPTGSFLPNAFGLHDVHGNVTEWCRDEYGPYRSQNIDPEDGEALRRVLGKRNRVFRGGSYMSPAVEARSTYRQRTLYTRRFDTFGVRPSRRLR